MKTVAATLAAMAAVSMGLFYEFLYSLVLVDNDYGFTAENASLCSVCGSGTYT